MAFSIRVELTPTPLPSPGVAVAGCLVGLAPMGRAGTAATPTSPQPATLTFSGIFLERARDPQNPVERQLGSLSGTLSLEGPNATPVFSIDGPLQGTANDTPDETADTSVRLRLLQLAFSDASFDVPAGVTFDLPLPLDLEQTTAHLEVSVELSVAGQVEAPAKNNDILDVPLLPRKVLIAKLVDEIGEPVAGQTLELDFDGELVQLATNAEGAVRVVNPATGVAQLRFPDPDALRAKLKPRWDAPREGALVSPAPRRHTVQLRDALDPVQVVAGMNVVSVQPPVTQARLLGMFFELNKNFLLPTALPSLSQIKALYDQNPSSQLLVVGHTDTSADPATNDPLSVERAEAVAQYLAEDVDAWLARYGSKVPEKKRWSRREDLFMIASFDGFDDRPQSQDEVSFFQTVHNQSLSDPPDPNQTPRKNTQPLAVDGVMSVATRAALIEDYMRRDGASLPSTIKLVLHGCGENFPLDDAGEDLDVAARDGQRDQLDRRVELFFFDGRLGVQPRSPGKNSKKGSREYPEWRRRARESTDFVLDLFDRTLRIRMQDHGKPISAEDYEIRVDGTIFAAGKTASDGLIEEPVPGTSLEALVRLPRLGIERVISLGPTEAFPPVSTVLGVQLRLRQLGFFFGTADGQGGPQTNGAIRAFKISQRLPANGVLDQRTRQALTSAYGS